MLEVGVARTEITAYEPGLGMMGWGMLDNVVKSVATPLHARAFVLREGEAVQAWVCCELAFVTLALREAVCARLRDDHPQLGLDTENVLMMATHTHSGPGGITHYPFYNITIPGFAASVVDRIADGVARAITRAHARLQPAKARYSEGEFSPNSEVAFNRSIEAYNLNPDVERVTEQTRRLALDRKLRLVRFDDDKGQPLGSINWFAVHCTSVHSDNTAIHFDNKGYAARFVEQEMERRGAAGFVAAFAQGAPGDVTPNFRRYKQKPWVRGKYLDDDKSAAYNGRLQADMALRVQQDALDTAPLSPELQSAHRFVDFASIDVDPKFADGRPGLRTAGAEIGMSMFFGTEEGPGLPRDLLFLQQVASRVRPWLRKVIRRPKTPQAEKITWVDTGRRKLLGIERLSRLPLPWRAHATLRLIRKLETENPGGHPWTPNILPVHLVRLGSVAIAAVPAEFTTVAGRRLRQTIKDATGVDHPVLAGYANAYAGYVTTPQEYALQLYEGASTHFGKWTLPAYQTEFARLAAQLAGEGREPGPEPRPPVFTPEELAARAFPA